nr:unnamed protein product [Digitaria exilis]
MAASPGPRTSRSQEADSTAGPAASRRARTVADASRRRMGQPHSSAMRRIFDTCAAARSLVFALMSSIAARKLLGDADGLAQAGVRGALGGGGGGEVLPELLDHAIAHHVVHPAVEVLREQGLLDVDPEKAARGAERGAVAMMIPPPPRVGGGGGGGEGVAGGGGVEAVGEEGVDEGVGPAGDDGDAAPRGDRGGRGGGDGAERRGRELAGVGADGAEEVVRDAAAVSEGHLVGRDVEAGVELDLVGVHDLPADLPRHVDGQLGLAGARGADDHHHARPVEGAEQDDEPLLLRRARCSRSSSSSSLGGESEIRCGRNGLDAPATAAAAMGALHTSVVILLARRLVM